MHSSKKKEVNVVAAIIWKGEGVYCFKRGEGKYDYISNKYEFPGGKVNVEEKKEDALVREIQEELGVKIKIKREYMSLTHEYPDFIIHMTCFSCNLEGGEIKLGEHTDFKLLEISKLNTLEWLNADKPVVNQLQIDYPS